MTIQTSRITIGIAIGLLALLAAPAVYAQSTMRVDIPFQFHVQNQVLPAGAYRVSYDAAFQRMALLLPDGSGMFLPAHTAYRPRAEYVGSLVFHKYGNAYFLRQVWTPGGPYGFGLLASKAEREIAKVQPAFQTAWVRTQPK